MCFIIDNRNIFIHNPKCGGTTVSSIIMNNVLDKYAINKKVSKGHFGCYSLIHSGMNITNFNKRIIIRDPIEWYVSQYEYTKKSKKNPYYVFSKYDFKTFFNNLIDMSHINIDYMRHLEYHINDKYQAHQNV